MRISCIVPVHDAERHLAAAIDSVLAQDWPLHEIVAVDDGSTDRSAEILAAYAGRVIIVTQPHAGVSAARNTGLRHASGDVIAFQDADDLWPPGRLRAMATALAGDPAIDVVAGLVEILDQREAKPKVRETLDTMHRVNMGAHLIRRRVFDRVGLFNESLEVSEDTELVMRMRRLGIAIAQIDTVALIYRLHAGNISGTVDRNQSNTLDALRTLSLMRRGR